MTTLGTTFSAVVGLIAPLRHQYFRLVLEMFFPSKSWIRFLECWIFTSVLCFSRTSWQANDVAIELREYRELMFYHLKILVATQATGIIKWNSIGTLHAALRSASCVSCGEWAPLLHLPTCQRYCYTCCHKGGFWCLRSSLFDPFPDIKLWLEAQTLLRANARRDCDSEI